MVEGALGYARRGENLGQADPDESLRGDELTAAIKDVVTGIGAFGMCVF